jgi:hypothetical protein
MHVSIVKQRYVADEMLFAISIEGRVVIHVVVCKNVCTLYPPFLTLPSFRL